jgi:hypothetical protein
MPQLLKQTLHRIQQRVGGITAEPTTVHTGTTAVQDIIVEITTIPTTRVTIVTETTMGTQDRPAVHTTVLIHLMDITDNVTTITDDVGESIEHSTEVSVTNYLKNKKSQKAGFFVYLISLSNSIPAKFFQTNFKSKVLQL